MSNLPSGSGSPNHPSIPPFNPNAAHHQMPRVRPLRGFPQPAQLPDGKQITMLGLADATQISDRVCVVVPAVQMVIPLLDGSRTLDQVVSQIGQGLTVDFLRQLIAQLDDAGLLEGPVFEGLYAKMKQDFDSKPTLPPGSTAGFVDALIAEGIANNMLAETASQAEKDAFGRVALAESFDKYIAEALRDVPDPIIPTLPLGIVAPHLDYGRGWINYAAVYGRLRECSAPDRIIILGTNHFGKATGICACDKGYETILGTCQVDQPSLDILRAKLGAQVFAERYDHEREHSIELHIPWIQHTFGVNEHGAYPTVVGILVHDPAIKNGESYDGKGVALDPFVAALQEIVKLPGKTLVISSADLSHAGQAFGDQALLGGEEQPAVEARNKVFQHDQELIQMYANQQVAGMISAMAWQQNPTRWCSMGNLIVPLLALKPRDVKVLNYSAAMDPEGYTMVTSMAAVLLA